MSLQFPRPLSPHLTWYRPQITSVLSIAHRLTGIALSVGTLVLLWWLIAVDAGGGVYDATRAVLSSPLGILVLAAWSAAFFFHLCSGIRHLLWDVGFGFEIKTVYMTGYTVLAVSAVLTILSWIIAAFL